MVSPVVCDKCGSIVGLAVQVVTGDDSLKFFPPRGVCNHTPAKVTQTKCLFGLVEHSEVYYKETETSSSWDEYVGPHNKFLLWFALLVNDGALLFRGEWIFWAFDGGFFGAGLALFEKTKKERMLKKQ